MSVSQLRHPKCAHCGHAWSKHTTQPVNPCAQRIPVEWRGWGRSKRPVMGYCPCIKYVPKGSK